MEKYKVLSQSGGKNTLKVFSPPPTKKVLAGAWGKAEGHTLRTLWLETPEVGICVGAWAMVGSGVEGGCGGLGGG